MQSIEVKVLNPEVAKDAERMVVAMAKLTQRGERITSMADLEELIAKPYQDATVERICSLPHPTLQKFGVINVAVVGASRRFLAQITRHQNEVKFMSGSLQYSDYSGRAQFCMPYEILEKAAAPCPYELRGMAHSEEMQTSVIETYLNSCEQQLAVYEALAKVVGRDAAGYAMPQGLRNVLLISATPYQFKHMIAQRTCNRNTLETQYVMLRIWEELFKLSPMFGNTGPTCSQAPYFQCHEGKMSCGDPMDYRGPSEILNTRFSLLRKKGS